MAWSFVRNAMFGSRKFGRSPAASPYHAIISSSRLVVRFTWWNTGLGTPSSATSGDLPATPSSFALHSSPPRDRAASARLPAPSQRHGRGVRQRPRRGLAHDGVDPQAPRRGERPPIAGSSVIPSRSRSFRGAPRTGARIGCRRPGPSVFPNAVQTHGAATPGRASTGTHADGDLLTVPYRAGPFAPVQRRPPRPRRTGRPHPRPRCTRAASASPWLHRGRDARRYWSRCR